MKVLPDTFSVPPMLKMAPPKKGVEFVDEGAVDYVKRGVAGVLVTRTTRFNHQRDSHVGDGGTPTRGRVPDEGAVGHGHRIGIKIQDRATDAPDVGVVKAVLDGGAAVAVGKGQIGDIDRSGINSEGRPLSVAVEDDGRARGRPVMVMLFVMTIASTIVMVPETLKSIVSPLVVLSTQ
jgi:hypothetical protein